MSRFRYLQPVFICGFLSLLPISAQAGICDKIFGSRAVQAIKNFFMPGEDEDLTKALIAQVDAVQTRLVTFSEPPKIIADLIKDFQIDAHAPQGWPDSSNVIYTEIISAFKARDLDPIKFAKSYAGQDKALLKEVENLESMANAAGLTIHWLSDPSKEGTYLIDKAILLHVSVLTEDPVPLVGLLFSLFHEICHAEIELPYAFVTEVLNLPKDEAIKAIHKSILNEEVRVRVKEFDYFSSLCRLGLCKLEGAWHLNARILKLLKSHQMAQADVPQYVRSQINEEYLISAKRMWVRQFLRRDVEWVRAEIKEHGLEGASASVLEKIKKSLKLAEFDFERSVNYANLVLMGGVKNSEDEVAQAWVKRLLADLRTGLESK